MHWLWLFPRAWRARYEAEFRALLEDSPPTFRERLDILLSAFDARLRPQAWAIEERDRQLVLQASGGPPAPAPGTKLTVGGASAKRPAPVEPDDRRFSRRTFLRNALLGGVGVVAAGGAVAATNFGWPNKTGSFGKEIVIPLTQLPAPGGAPLKHNDGKFWLINNEDGLLALYWKCPHLGCTVPWEDSSNEFHCPCHQSVYDRHGVRISGPAPRPMDLMTMYLDDTGNLIVDTGAISERDEYRPEQAFQFG
jgi:cytochrome b6-f complex iron-sulfur subunit